MSGIVMEAVGVVGCSRVNVEDDNWDRETSWIKLDEDRFTAEAFAGIESFSHVVVVFLMDRVVMEKIESGARHPRNNTEWPKVGIFAQRGKNRPNRIGVTVCRVLRVEGRQLYVQGLDAVDGTPVLDVKPWVEEFGPRGEVSQPGWMSELMRGYWGG